MSANDGDKLILHEVPGTPTPGELVHAAAQATAGKSTLEAVQKSATDWRTGLAGMLTIVTGAFLFKGTTEIREYSPPTQFTLGLLGIGAAVFGVAGLWVLLVAAHGSYKKVKATQITGVGGLNAWYLDVASNSLSYLKVGKVLSLVSVILIGVLLAMSWYAPTAPDDPPAQIRVTESGVDVARCGTLTVADSKGVTFQVSGERDPRSVPFDRLVAVVLVEKC